MSGENDGGLAPERILALLLADHKSAEERKEGVAHQIQAQDTCSTPAPGGTLRSAGAQKRLAGCAGVRPLRGLDSSLLSPPSFSHSLLTHSLTYDESTQSEHGGGWDAHEVL